MHGRGQENAGAPHSVGARQSGAVTASGVVGARETGVVTIEKTFAILELVAERGGATAKEVSDALGYPLPTVYRLMATLVRSDYLVHLRDEKRFELGYKLDRLGVSLHRQVGVPATVRAEIARLHQTTEAAGYFAVYRGADVVVAYVDDCPEHRRIQPLRFGFHEAAHATAFGKTLLAGMAAEGLDQYLAVHGLAQLTPFTITSRAELDAQLRQVATSGIAWEHAEFVPGMTCAAIGVHNGAGALIGAVAVSAPSSAVSRERERSLERILRETANNVSTYYRSGTTRR